MENTDATRTGCAQGARNGTDTAKTEKPTTGFSIPRRDALEALLDAEKKLLDYCTHRSREHLSSVRINNCAKEVRAMIKVLLQYQ